MVTVCSFRDTGINSPFAKIIEKESYENFAIRKIFALTFGYISSRLYTAIIASNRFGIGSNEFQASREIFHHFETIQRVIRLKLFSV